jgi:U3 small nucleolar RNA-associated protein 21
MMATSSMNGDIAIWDLEKRTLFHTISHAHDAAVQSAQFLNGSPILLTSGSDNSIKVCLHLPLTGIAMGV